jgi:Ca2+-binding EF-hand superfamily protein
LDSNQIEAASATGKMGENIAGASESSKSFCNTSSEVMAWKALLNHEYAMLDCLPKPETNFKLKQPWDPIPRTARRVRKERANPPPLVQTFQRRLAELAIQKRQENGGTDKSCMLQIFISIDVDSDGRINFEEFRRACEDKLQLGFRREEQEQVFRWYDRDGSGAVSYHEMIAGADKVSKLHTPWHNTIPSVGSNPRHNIKPSKTVAKFQKALKRAAERKGLELGMKPESVLRDIFTQYDTDGNGRLDLAEMRRAAGTLEGCSLTMEEGQDIMKWYDTDCRGTVSYWELVNEVTNRAIVTTARKNIILHTKVEAPKKGFGSSASSSSLALAGAASLNSARNSARMASLSARGSARGSARQSSRRSGSQQNEGEPMNQTARQMMQVQKLRMQNDLLKLKIEMRKLQMSQ